MDCGGYYELSEPIRCFESIVTKHPTRRSAPLGRDVTLAQYWINCTPFHLTMDCSRCYEPSQPVLTVRGVSDPLPILKGGLRFPAPPYIWSW